MEPGATMAGALIWALVGLFMWRAPYKTRKWVGITILAISLIIFISGLIALDQPNYPVDIGG